MKTFLFRLETLTIVLVGLTSWTLYRIPTVEVAGAGAAGVTLLSTLIRHLVRLWRLLVRRRRHLSPEVSERIELS